MSQEDTKAGRLARAGANHSLVAWENHRSRVNVALGLEADGFSKGAACARPQVPQRSGLSG